MKYTKEEILSKVDHTLLKPEATWPQIQALCDDAIKYHTASVCINTCYVKQAVQYMAGRVAVCCVVGFPLGAMDTASKCFEAKTAVENGAEEVDMVINIGRLKNKEYDAVREDIAAVKRAVGDKVLKVIIETCLLTDEEKEKMCFLFFAFWMVFDEENEDVLPWREDIYRRFCAQCRCNRAVRVIK